MLINCFAGYGGDEKKHANIYSTLPKPGTGMYALNARYIPGFYKVYPRVFKVLKEVKMKNLVFYLTLAVLPLNPQISTAQNYPNHFDPDARETALDISALPAIRFLTTQDFPPFNYLTPGGELVGYNVDLAYSICENLEIACTMQVWPWEQAADALADNQGDALLAGLAISPQNGVRFDFSQIYIMFPGRFVAPESKVSAFDPDELEGALIGVRKGSNHLEFVQRYLSGAHPVQFDTEVEALEALETGEVSLYFGDALRASIWLNENPDCCAFAGEAYFHTQLFGQGLAVAFPADHDLARRAVNLALGRLKRDGTLDELYLRWFPVSFY